MGRECTYDVLSLDEVNEFSVLRVIHMGAEGDIVHRYFARNSVAFQSNKVFWLCEDVLGANANSRWVSLMHTNSTRWMRGSGNARNTLMVSGSVYTGR